MRPNERPFDLTGACLGRSTTALAILAASLVACEGPPEANDPHTVDTIQQALGSPGDVGVIPHGTACPSGVHLGAAYMDTEDSQPTTLATGWTGAWRVTGPNVFPAGGQSGGISLCACRLPGSLFKPLTTDPNAVDKFYAVLQMGESCPAQSVSFTRRFDNEDSGNTNTTFSDIQPSEVKRQEQGASYLRFCLFRHSATNDTMPDFPFVDEGFPYGVFARPSAPPFLIDSGRIRSDDEDTSNGNTMSAGSVQIVVQAASIIEPVDNGRNTVINFARVW